MWTKRDLSPEYSEIKWDEIQNQGRQNLEVWKQQKEKQLMLVKENGTILLKMSYIQMANIECTV